MSKASEALQRLRAKKNLQVKTAANKEVVKSEKPTALDNMSIQISSAKDKLATHLQEQEEKGVYNFSDKIHQIDGLDADLFISTMKNLDAAVVEKTPDIRKFSIMIRKNLAQYQELSHLLTDEQLHILVSGMLYVAGVETAPKTKQGKAAADSKRVKELLADDLSSLGL